MTIVQRRLLADQLAEVRREIGRLQECVEELTPDGR
jgi:hypothetical protein